MRDKSRILIVEDDEAFVELLTEYILENYPKVEIDSTHNGADALKALSGEDYALILLDLQMPVMGGLTFAKEFKERYPDRKTPIVIISSFIDECDREKLNSLNITESFNKLTYRADAEKVFKKILA